MARSSAMWFALAVGTAVSACGSGEAFSDSARGGASSNSGGAAALVQSSGGSLAAGGTASGGRSQGGTSNDSASAGALVGGSDTAGGLTASFGGSAGAEPIGGAAGSEGEGGATSGGAANGGATSGGAANGGATSGGAANGGATSGGAASGGAANGGAANGGAANGGAANGGVDGGGGKTAAQGGALGSGGTTQTKCGLVINEIQVGSSVSPADEFVELYNSCAVAQALNGYELVYRAASGTSDVLLHTFSSSDVIAGKGFLLLAGASFAGTSDMSLGGGVNGVLALQAGGLALRTANAVIIDALGYGNATNAFVEGAPALAPTLGTSISRVPDGRDMNDNWQDFSATTSTPRGANH